MKVEQTNFVRHLIITAVPDPDLEIRWGRDSVWSKIKGKVGPRAPLLDLPLYNPIILLIIKEPVC